MFTNKEEDARVTEISSSSNTISKDTSIDGNVETTGNLRIEGTVKGNIRARSKIVLGNSGEVEGKVFAQTADIEGTIKGTIQVEGMLTLKSTANIKGDIKTGKLAMEAGAIFDGKCKMGSFKNPEDLASAEAPDSAETPGKVEPSAPKSSPNPVEAPERKFSKPSLSSSQA
jgi:cytoskeletal protein CcmA (bactofilin family)